MSKSLDTLVEDIYKACEDGAEFSDDIAEAFGKRMAEMIKSRLHKDNRQAGNYLRLSSVGTHCDRKTWLTVNHPDVAEPLDGKTRLKFLIGDVWEEILLVLTKIAGHDVQGEQDELYVAGIKGHRDAIINGVTVDVKSASPFAFAKFSNGLSPEHDDFGYLTQLGGYVTAGQSDPRVMDKNHGAFLAVDKVSGELCVDIHNFEGQHQYIHDRVERKKAVVASDKLPGRGYDDEPDGKSGNRKLGTACSYCAVKHSCWPGLRTFMYKSGTGFKPRFLTEVRKTPDVPEAT